MKNIELFLQDQSAELVYQDESLNKFYYKSFSNDSWTSGNAQCQALGGHLPNIKFAGKQQFLVSTFQAKIWVGLTTDSQRLKIHYKPDISQRKPFIFLVQLIFYL